MISNLVRNQDSDRINAIFIRLTFIRPYENLMATKSSSGNADLADIGIFGGSGFYKLFDKYEEKMVETPYGPPSAAVAIGTMGGKRVAFMPRHGEKHTIPPHKVPFRANLWAMQSLGVTRLVSPCAAGSLQAHVKPGEFVVCDQFVDRTSSRADTFYDGPITTHVSPA